MPVRGGAPTPGSTTLPDEAALEAAPDAPVFVQLVPAFQEPDIAGTVRALLASRYPHGKLHVVVVTKEEEERSPHPAMAAPTAELVRRLRQELPPYQQKMLSQLAMPGPGRKAHQLNWALRAGTPAGRCWATTTIRAASGWG